MPSFNVDASELTDLAAHTVLQALTKKSNDAGLKWKDSNSPKLKDAYFEKTPTGVLARFPVEAMGEDFKLNEKMAECVQRCVFIKHRDGVYRVITAEPLETWVEKRLILMLAGYNKYVKGTVSTLPKPMMRLLSYLPRVPQVDYGGYHHMATKTKEVLVVPDWNEDQKQSVLIVIMELVGSTVVDALVKKEIIEMLSLKFKVTVPEPEAKQIQKEAKKYLKMLIASQEAEQPEKEEDLSVENLTPEALRRMLEEARAAGRAEGAAGASNDTEDMAEEYDIAAADEEDSDEDYGNLGFVEV